MPERESNGERIIPIVFLTPGGVILKRFITAGRAKEMHEELKQKFGDLKPSEKEGLKIAITETDGEIEVIFALDIWIDITETRYLREIDISQS